MDIREGLYELELSFNAIRKLCCSLIFMGRHSHVFLHTSEKKLMSAEAQRWDSVQIPAIDDIKNCFITRNRAAHVNVCAVVSPGVGLGCFFFF